MTTFPAALAKFEIHLSEPQRAGVEAYCRLLWEWNERLNLTRHLDFETFVSGDVLDAVQLAELLTAGERVLDVGSGGGVPGILLGILRPDVQITLCDSIRKKTRALDDMVSQLALPITVQTSRVQDLLPKHAFDTL